MSADAARPHPGPARLLTSDGTDQPIDGTTDATTSGAGYAVVKSSAFRIQLPTGSDRAWLPGALVMQMTYHGDNSSQQASFAATPIDGSGTSRSGEISELVTPGSPQCSSAYLCHDFARYDFLPIDGVGCGYNLSGTSRHAAWIEKYSTSTSTAAPVRYGIQSSVGNASTSGEDCPQTVSTACTDGGTQTGSDGGAISTGSDFDRISRLGPNFDCSSTDGSGTGTLHQVCVTYVTGFYSPDTDTYEITGSWTDCWLEWEPAASMDRITAGALSFPSNASVAPATASSAVNGPSSPAAGGKVAITLVGTGAIAGGEPTRIVRRRQGEVRDAILVDLGKASDADLASAIAGYLALLTEQGENVAKDVEGVVTISSLGRDWQTTERPGVHATLEALRSAPKHVVPGIGHGRTLTITAPVPRVWRQPSTPRGIPASSGN